MECFEVTGGTALTGRVRVTGAKNSALKLMAAALLAPGLTTIEEVPDILDVAIMSEVLRRLGCDVEYERTADGGGGGSHQHGRDESGPSPASPEALCSGAGSWLCAFRGMKGVTALGHVLPSQASHQVTEAVKPKRRASATALPRHALSEGRSTSRVSRPYQDTATAHQGVIKTGTRGNLPA